MLQKPGKEGINSLPESNTTVVNNEDGNKNECYLHTHQICINANTVHAESVRPNKDQENNEPVCVHRESTATWVGKSSSIHCGEGRSQLRNLKARRQQDNRRSMWGQCTLHIL